MSELGEMESWVREQRRLLAQHVADTTPPARGGNVMRPAFLTVLVVVAVWLTVICLVRGCGSPAKHRRLNPVMGEATFGGEPAISVEEVI